MKILSSASRLNWSLVLLRWLLVIGAATLAFLLPLLNERGADEALPGRLLAGAGVGALVALIGTGLLWMGNSPTPGILSLMIDTAYALLLFWASGGMPFVLIGAGMLPVVTGALRVGGLYGFLSATVTAAGGVLLYGLSIAPGEPLGPALLAAGTLLLVAVFVCLPVAVASLGWIGEQMALREREREAARLRAAREHARAIYEMASTLTATLNYRAVLDAALDVGVLGLRESNPNARLVSAVFLYDENTGLLKVANSRRLTRTDVDKQVPGKRGVLGLALQQAEPVFASDAERDPELQYFVAFQDARSILCVPLRAGFENYGVLVFSSTVPNAFSEEHVELMTAVASQATISLKNAMLYQDLLDEKNRIIQVEEEARKQLSRDLHDGPVQDVSSIAMRTNYVRRLLERDPEQVLPELQHIEDIARQTVKQMRQMLFTLRPLILESQGLGPALEELAKKMKETHNQNVILQVEPGIERYIDSNDQTVLFNIVDEAVNNARKHAVAEHIWVRLARRDTYLWLEVQDDGVGFDQGAVDANYDRRGSLGMINLRERAELLNGNLNIESAEGRGTKITLIAPIRDSILKELNDDAGSTAAARLPDSSAAVSPTTSTSPAPRTVRPATQPARSVK